MRHISPLKIWHNGTHVQATTLTVISIYDDLETTATLRYDLCTDEGTFVASGELSLTDEAYQDWDNSNDYAYNYVANQINVTIIPSPPKEEPSPEPLEEEVSKPSEELTEEEEE